MAKSRRKRKAQRDTFDIANPFTGLLSPSALSRSGQLLQIEDRRRFSPLSYDPMPVTRRRVAKVVVKPRKPMVKAKRGFFFSSPAQVIMCVRRKVRREVLNALGVAGGVVSRRRRRNAFSSVRC